MRHGFWSRRVPWCPPPLATLCHAPAHNHHVTAAADVGLSLDKDSNINYRFSLPNKLFDYIQCNTPVVTSRVVEVKRIVEDYNVGLTVHVENILALRRSIAAVAEHREAYEPGLKHAQEALSWEKECIPLRNFYAQFL